MGTRLDLEAIKQRVADDRARKGLIRQPLIADLQPGAVFIVNDAVIDFPESKLPGATRTLHTGRRIIVVQCAALCRPERPKTLQVVPVTMSMEGGLPSYYCELPEDEPGFDPGRKVALTQLVQPVLKSDLEKFMGVIRAETMVKVLKSLMFNFGFQQPLLAEQAEPVSATRSFPK